MFEVTKELAEKVLATVDVGLVRGKGEPIPGQMCVEAAVCFAMGLPHNDNPPCVAPTLRNLKIKLNDSNWSSSESRAKGMRRLAIAQLGSVDVLNEKVFAQKVVTLVISKYLPKALRAAAAMCADANHKQALELAAVECEMNPCKESAEKARKAASAAYNAYDDAAASAASAAYNAYDAAASAAYAASASVNIIYHTAKALKALNDESILFNFAEEVVQILIEMDAPGCEFLFLTE